jgi:hypothetical protein
VAILRICFNVMEDRNRIEIIWSGMKALSSVTRNLEREF